MGHVGELKGNLGQFFGESIEAWVNTHHAAQLPALGINEGKGIAAVDRF